MSESGIPFGMLFEEENTVSASDSIPRPIYNPDEALSQINDTEGNLVPFVTWGWVALGATKTSTTTRSEADKDDPDFWSDEIVRFQGTKTRTKENGETTDED